jgi:hypothetical protein
VGDKLVSPGPAVTGKFIGFVATPPTATTTFPVDAPAGTATTTDVALQLNTWVTGVPLNVTVLVANDGPKFDPVIVTCAPTGPDAGDKLVKVGAGPTVNHTLLVKLPGSVA